MKEGFPPRAPLPQFLLTGRKTDVRLSQPPTTSIPEPLPDGNVLLIEPGAASKPPFESLSNWSNRCIGLPHPALLGSKPHVVGLNADRGPGFGTSNWMMTQPGRLPASLQREVRSQIS